MIHALDRIVVAAASTGAAVQSYATLLGRGAEASGNRASFQLANVRLELTPTAQVQDDERLIGLVFAVRDLAKAQHLLGRRGLRVHMTEEDCGAGAGRLHVATDSAHGVPLSLIERQPNEAAESADAAVADPAAAVAGLDHVVIRSPNPERAVALYAGRLGLSLRLDRSEPAWGARLLFFRCGDLIVEVAHDLKGGVSDERDTLWGLSWRVPDAARANARLRAAGVEVSPVRSGRRPGTLIFTVRSHTEGVPTIMIGPETPAAA